MRALLALTLVAGCGGTFEPRRDQGAAERAVWLGVYGETGPAPPVEWREPECLDEVSHPGVWSYNVRGAPASCRSGFYWLGGGVVVAQRPEAETNWISLFHEWLHAKAWLDLGGDADVGHDRLDWGLEYEALAAITSLEAGSSIAGRSGTSARP